MSKGVMGLDDNQGPLPSDLPDDSEAAATPSLDVERLAAAIHAHKMADPGPVDDVCREIAHRIAAEYARLAATDTEGEG